MYKVYKTGQDFLDENLNIIRNDPLGATFFEANVKMIPQCDKGNYAVRVEVDGSLLLAIHVGEYPLVLYGSEKCVDEFAQVVTQSKLQFNRTIGSYDISNAFLQAYERLVGGSHKVNLSMDIMYCDKVNYCDTTGVEQATTKDIEEITQLVVDFNFEAMSEKSTWGGIFDKISHNIDNYAILRVNEKIVSIGYSNTEGTGLHRISNVYTKPEHRNKGYSRKVVTYLTERALKSGNLPCLHVDQHNPVSNHLYQTIGYTYGKSRYEMIYIPAHIEE